MTDAADPLSIEGAFSGTVGAFVLDARLSMPGDGVTGLMGPSGGGKTTLLHCIAGLRRLDGRLRVLGEDWQTETLFLKPHRRPVGYVFQNAALFDHLSVRANLMFGYRRSPRPRPVSLDETTDLLGLDRLLDRSTLALSGGERQRVAIGRALLSQPRLLLMDEPLSGLDTDSRAEILPYLERLHRTLSIPVLYVSHDPAELARLTDRVLTMKGGRILGTTETGRDLVAIKDRLAALTADQVSRLALAALRAGLPPV